MEKKRNQVARNGQQTSDFYNKKDVSAKQYRRRKESSFQSEFSSGNKQQTSNKYRNNNNNGNFHFDKRPPTRKSGNGSGFEQNENHSFGETSGLMELDGEINSVFNHGSRKQNLNHLLNFHKYTKDADDGAFRYGAFSKHGYHHRPYSKRYQYNKEQYLQANCQFIVKADAKYDYRPFTVSPDTLVEWDRIIKVLISSTEESQCPICLYPPKAAKISKCGHIYCFSCMLHYLSLSDKSWRKCPICYESIHLNDLKSATSKHNHQSYKVGDYIDMELMKREKGSLFVNKASEIFNINEFPNFSNIEGAFTYSKLIMANESEILKIIEQEKNELDFQLAENGFDCPESIFVQQAIDLLSIKEKEIEKLMNEQSQHESHQNEERQPSKSSITLQTSVSESISTSNGNDIADDEATLIDEDCNLTVHDIDILPVASNLQSKHFYYYQAPNAQNVFMHSMNSRMLQQMFGSLERSPQKIRGKIVQTECCSMNENLRKRLKYLQHLPVSSVFEVVEIEFEAETISQDVLNLFKDELLHRRKMRQRREREEKKRERVINEINERQMGKMVKNLSANIDIGSTAQFPECGNFNDMPALGSNVSDRSSSPSLSLSSSPAAGPSFARMLTSTNTNKSEKLWPSLASSPSTSSSSSFFGDKKIIHAAGNKGMSVTQPKSIKEEENEFYDEDDESECKAPAYKNSLSDALVNALKSANLNETNSGKAVTGKKKKAKKTLLFSSGMNFN